MQPAAEKINAIDQCLPQTQCTRCGYPRCYAYAEALAERKADINQCPPGGDITIKALAQLLHVPEKPLNPQYGVHETRKLAVIDEARCIGCTLCIQACPVDAISGAAKLMHTVIVQECTGCNLCVEPCPVDCITMVEYPAHTAAEAVPRLWPDYAPVEVVRARQRTENRLKRLVRRPKHVRRGDVGIGARSPEKLRAEILAAVLRSKAKRAKR